jgi:hypothetical protein
MADYTIDKANAEQDAWTFPATLTDPASYASEWASRVTAKYFGQPVLEELLALIYSRVSSKAYSKLWTCIAGLNVGDPVYISATDTVSLALATTEAASKVIGFVRYKPSTITCYIEHFVFKTGLAGLTAGNAVYLTDAGAFGATVGTVTKRVGTALDTDEAIVYAAGVNGICDLIEDASPTLGGALDANAKNITNIARLLIGATAFDSGTPLFEIASNTHCVARMLAANDDAGYGSFIYLNRARGTLAARTAPADGDDIGGIYGAGHTGSAWGVSCIMSMNADGVHGSGSTPGKIGFWTTPSGATAATLRMRIDKDGKVGINEFTPGTLLDMAGAAPYFTLHNLTEEDGDGGRESKLIFEGEQSGGELTTLGEIEISHDGASDDEKGKFILRLNDGDDDAAPTTRLTIASDGLATLAGNLYPGADDTYYLGKNDDDSPLAWKAVILKDTTNGKYYRVEVISGVVTATDLTD